MADWLYVNPAHREMLDRAKLGGLDAWMSAARGSEGPRDRGESLAVVELPAFRVFLKRYRADGAARLGFLRRSRVRREAENAMLLRAAGVPTADVVAAGERRRLGRPVEAFLATREIVGARALASLAAEYPPGVRGRRRREKLALVEKLALIVRRMHDAGYVAHDLYVRNVLVTDGPDGSRALWLIDHPRGSQRLWGRADGFVRDLACLRRDLPDGVTGADVARFVKFYLGLRRLDRRAAKFMRAVDGRKPPRTPER